MGVQNVDWSSMHWCRQEYLRVDGREKRCLDGKRNRESPGYLVAHKKEGKKECVESPGSPQKEPGWGGKTSQCVAQTAPDGAEGRVCSGEVTQQERLLRRKCYHE